MQQKIQIGITLAYAERWKDTAAWVLDLSQPLKPTTSMVQQNAKHVIATATLRNIITSVERIVSHKDI